MKLNKLLNIFNKKSLIIDEKKEQCYFEILRNFIPDVFLTEKDLALNQNEVDFIQDYNDETIANLRRDDNRPKHLYNEDYLPYHVRDDQWLAKYLMHIIKDYVKDEKMIEKRLFQTHKNFNKNFQIINGKESTKSYLESEYEEIVLVDTKKFTEIPMSTILKFIKIDLEFNEAREAYEIDLTRAQIKYMMENEEPNEVLKHNKYERNDIHSVEVLYQPGISRFKKDTDKLFRQAVLTGLTQNLGLDTHSVEYGLEKYAPLWREQTMNDAFYNQYAVNFDDVKLLKADDTLFETALEKFRGDWVHQREIEYGKEHATIIKEVGSETPSMNFTAEQIDVMNKRIVAFSERYQQAIQRLTVKKAIQDNVKSF